MRAHCKFDQFLTRPEEPVFLLRGCLYPTQPLRLLCPAFINGFAAGH